jgi:uncharacterized protein (TIGR02145 family)
MRQFQYSKFILITLAALMLTGVSCLVEDSRWNPTPGANDIYAKAADTCGLVAGNNYENLKGQRRGDFDAVLGYTVTFFPGIDGSADNLSFFWDFGDGDVSDSVLCEHAFLSTGDFNVKLIATDRAGIKIEDSILVHVNDPEKGWLAGPDTAVGINDTVLLQGSFSNRCRPVTDIEYAWKCGDGAWVADADGDTLFIAPATAQSVVCSLRVTDDGKIQYDMKTVDVCPVKDIDGNLYHSVIIGTQEWTVENLKTATFNDGTPIPLVTDGTDWENLTTAGYCWFNNESVANKETYGALYNWYAVNTGKLAPAGWHIPSDWEWTVLSDYLGGENVAGGKMKEAGTVHWSSPNEDATNSSGFSALPGGARYLDGDFRSQSDSCIWWSATEFDASNAYNRSIGCGCEQLNRYYYNNNMGCGYSVRLVRDSN